MGDQPVMKACFFCFLSRRRDGFLTKKSDGGKIKKNLITTESQFCPKKGIVATLFTGVCVLDGHSGAPMDGFMASRKRGGYTPVVFT